MTTETERELRTSPEIGGMGHSVKRKEDPRFIRGAGEYIDDVVPARPALAGHRPQPVRPRDDQGHRRVGGAQDPGRPGRDHRRRPREGRPALDADPRRRQADGAADRHGHVPGPGSRRGRRDLPLHRRRRRRRGPRRLRAAAGHRRSVQGARAGCLRPATRSRAGQAEQPHLALGIGRCGQGGCRPGGRRGPRLPGHLHPADPRRLDRDLRLHRRLGCRPRPADPAHDQPGATRDPDGAGPGQRPARSRTSGSRPTTSAAGSAARCRSIRATSSPSWPA